MQDLKIAGSAQRRQQKGLLQHGSILLAASKFAPELPGLVELAPENITPDELTAAWLPRLLSALKMTGQQSALSPDERSQAEWVMSEKHGHDDWISRR